MTVTDLNNDKTLVSKISKHVTTIYGANMSKKELDECHSKIISLLDKATKTDQQTMDRWSENTVVLITYANSIIHKDDKPLSTLEQFLNDYCKNIISIVHILPFFPSSSDDGFAVIDYYKVDSKYGDWENINKISKKFSVMSDMVINHGSSKSEWFKNFLSGKGKGSNYFLSFDSAFDTSEVVRPRTNELLQKFITDDGEKFLWCTFSKDQIDYNFSNPDILYEFIEILSYHINQNITVFRFDAVAFLWKKVGTKCINLEETHELIRLFRTIMEYLCKKSILVTETNTPARENVSYFGNANEAQWIYNFSLPPILLYTILSGNSSHIEKLTMSMPPSQLGTSYLNFIASHDGIGLRPAEDFLTSKEIQTLIELMQENGGKVSYRTNQNGEDSPYELNISLLNAVNQTFYGTDELQSDRFICIHAIMMSLEGVPAFYIHSLLGTENDHELYSKTKHNRSLNRHIYEKIPLYNELTKDGTVCNKLYSSISDLLVLRKKQKAFHPNAVQFTLHLGKDLYGIWRQSLDKRQSIFCISNITNKNKEFSLIDINLIGFDSWFDLISGDVIEDLSSSLKLKPYQTVWITNTQVVD